MWILDGDEVRDGRPIFTPGANYGSVVRKPILNELALGHWFSPFQQLLHGFNSRTQVSAG